MSHVTVLLDEAVTALELTPDSVVVDATLGSAGHAQAICSVLGTKGTFIGIDADRVAIDNAEIALSNVLPQVKLVCSNFSKIREVAESLNIPSVDAIVADLGWRTDQFEDSNRGFSFKKDEPLIMTFGEPSGYPFVASDVLNDWSEEQIATVIYGYGEERYSRHIAKAIVMRRRLSPITTTFDLVTVIEGAVPASYRNGRINPATKTFQALRMVVNDEITVLETFLRESIALLNPHGRLAVITFHSIEDRVVKHYFREMKDAGVVELMTKKPLVPTRSEVLANPRSRSAKLRIIRKLVG